MEGLHRRREPMFSLQREFSGPRLEEQILKRVFELVIPSVFQEVTDVEALNIEADRVPLHTTRVQGA